MASSSPISITPAFSPGPWITFFPVVCRFLRCLLNKKVNPIVSIHDQGSGGMANVTREISEGMGATVYLDRVYSGDPTLTSLEKWVAEMFPNTHRRQAQYLEHKSRPLGRSRQLSQGVQQRWEVGMWDVCTLTLVRH